MLSYQRAPITRPVSQKEAISSSQTLKEVMTWTYNPGSEERLDKVRLFIGDTNEKDQLLSNEEIEVFLKQSKSDLFAAANACDAIVAKLVLLGENDKAESLRQTCKQLRRRAASSVGPVII